MTGNNKTESNQEQCTENRNKLLLGVPSNSMPLWNNLSLDCKLPMPDRPPPGSIELSCGRLCEKPWSSKRRTGFDLTDSCIRDSHALRYNALTDPYLADYLGRPCVARNLYRQGLITKDLRVKCDTKTFNGYRKLLHQQNLSQLRKDETQNAYKHLKGMLLPTLHAISHQKEEMKKGISDGGIQRRYSELFGNGVMEARENSNNEFNDSKTAQSLPEGEREFLQKVKNMMFEDYRKAALKQVRKLQHCDDRYEKSVLEFKRMCHCQQMTIDTNRRKEEDLKRERERHIQEHIECTKSQRDKMEGKIRDFSKKRLDELRCKGHKMAERLCKKVQRQWPLSARCPPDVLQGGTVDDCTKPYSGYRIEEFDDAINKEDEEEIKSNRDESLTIPKNFEMKNETTNSLNNSSSGCENVTDCQLKYIGRAVFACIDLDTIVNNINILKKLCRNPQMEVMGVVKANAFGHGAVEVSKYLIKTGAVERLAVANVPEAIQLRRAGIEGAIHVLGNTQAWEMDSCVQNELIPTVSTSEAIKGMAEALKRYREEFTCKVDSLNTCNHHSSQLNEDLCLSSRNRPTTSRLLEILNLKLIRQTRFAIKSKIVRSVCDSNLRNYLLHINNEPARMPMHSDCVEEYFDSMASSEKENNQFRDCSHRCRSDSTITTKLTQQREDFEFQNDDSPDFNKIKYKSGLPAGTVHIKVDTGMSRNGCQLGELDTLVQICRDCGVPLEGIFTHICNHEDDDYSKYQVPTFQRATEKYKDQGILFHISNSGSVLWDIGTNTDMIRPGLAMYGMSPGMKLDEFASLGFRPALSVKGTPTLVKLCSRGTKVGYGCTYTCPDDEWIATFPLGYADGFSRDLGHSGLQYVVRDSTGERCPVVGRVSMDAVTVKVPEEVQPGELFTFISADFDPIYSIAGMAESLKTIEHDVLVRITSRLPRVYFTQSSENIYSVNHALDLNQ